MTRAIEPSPATLQAVPSPSIATYTVMSIVHCSGVKPRIDSKRPSELMITPQATPGAATAVIAIMKMK